MKWLFTLTILIVTLLVQAGGTFTLIEINPLHGHSPLTLTSDSAKTYYGAGELSGFTQMNGKMYFSAQSTPGDDELWVTDGTVPGTSLVKAINPGHGAGIGNLVYVNGHILFMATDNGSSWDLWSTDGTDTGTIKIDQLNATSNTALGPTNVSVLSNRLIFCAQQKLLTSDGTASGTDSLLSIVGYSQGIGYCELYGYVYFVLPEVGGGNEIWRTDGTTSGTAWVLDLSNTPYNIATVNQMVSFSSGIYLSAADSGRSPRLYSFDGTIAGQINLVTIGADSNNSPGGLKVYNDTLYFTASDITSSNVYQISGANSVPMPLIPNSISGSLSDLSFANNRLYAMVPGGKQICAVELSNHAYNVLDLYGYYLPVFQDLGNEFLVGANGQVFFEAYDSVTNDQVFMQSDFTNAGTVPLMPAGANTNHPFNSYLNGSTIEDIFDLQMWGNNIIMPANFTDAGRELWLFAPAIANGVEEVKSEELFTIFPNPANNELTIRMTQCGNCAPQINIVNSDGQMIIQKLLNAETTVVNLTSLVSGDYFVTLIENGKMANTQKLVLVK